MLIKKKILIIGSCVSRDVVDKYREDFDLINYYARSSIVSLMSKPLKGSIDLSDIQSEFQKRMVKYDIDKDLVRNISSEINVADIILLDFIDERFDILEVDGSYITLSNEAKLSLSVNNLKGRVINSGSAEHISLWKAAWSKFFYILYSENSIDNVFVNQAFYANLNNAGGNYNNIGFNDSEILRCNEFLNLLYDFLKKYLSRDNIVKIPSQCVVGDSNHTWGESPFHYVNEYYEYVMRFLLGRLQYADTGPGFAKSSDGFYKSPQPFSDYIAISSLECNGGSREYIKSRLLIISKLLEMEVDEVSYGLFILSNKDFYFNENDVLVSGYLWKDKNLVYGSVVQDGFYSTIGSNGFYTALSFHKDKLYFFNDPFGMGSHYKYSDLSLSIITNRAHLAAYVISEISATIVNKAYLASSVLLHGFFQVKYLMIRLLLMVLKRLTRRV